MKARERGKPIIASIGNSATSAGYVCVALRCVAFLLVVCIIVLLCQYIASACDFIVADAASEVGCVGATVFKTDPSKLLEKLGIQFEEGKVPCRLLSLQLLYQS
jgi:ClpP class serine protease